MNFRVIQNDITNMLVDAIVLPANEHLKEGRGTSKAIFQKAGRKDLTRACKEIGSCKIGDAVPTLAYNLAANYIIHAVVPKWIDGEHQEYEYLSAAYLSALNIADVMECETIAFPLLAAGNNGFDLSLAYEIAKTSIESFEGNNLKSAILVVYGDTVATFLKGKGVYVENAKVFDKIHAVEDSTQLQVVQVKAAGKQIAKQILLEQMAKAVKYLEDPKNREKVVKKGIEIVKFVKEILPKKR